MSRWEEWARLWAGRHEDAGTGDGDGEAAECDLRRQLSVNGDDIDIGEEDEE